MTEEFDERALLLRTAAVLRAHPEMLAVQVPREHYLWLADEIEVCDALQGRRALGMALLKALNLKYIEMYEKL